MGRKFVLFLMAAIAATGLALLAQTGTAGATGSSGASELTCGMTITSDVRLRHDLSCDEGFVVDLEGAGASGARTVDPDVTIDLGGHTLTLTGSGVSCNGLRPEPDGCAIGVGQATVTITKGTIVGGVGFYRGYGGRGTISRVHVVGDVYLLNQQNELRRSVVDGTVTATGPTTVIDHDVIRGGIVLDDEANGFAITITDNLVSNPAGAGIRLVLAEGVFPSDVSGTIAHNVVTDSAGDGIEIVGEVRNLGALSIVGNRLTDNGGDGLSLRGDYATNPSPLTGGPVKVRGNTALRNGGHGIDLQWTDGVPTGIVDGGFNRANGNGEAPACIGVVCRGPVSS